MGVGIAINRGDQIGNKDSMGNQSREFQHTKRYKPPRLEQLIIRTKFSKKEIQSIYQGFKQECPSGLIDEQKFQNIYQQFFPSANASFYAHLVFSNLDLRDSGSVTFEDFLLCLSTLCRGTNDDRLKWIFNLYDINKCGKLTKENFHTILSAIYGLLGNVSNPEKNSESFEEHTKKIFEKFDSIQQGYLTWENFHSFCSRDPIIIRSIEALHSFV